MKVAIFTFGCKLNQAESQVIGEKLSRKGIKIHFNQKNCNADINLINSCAVTLKAEKEVRQLIHYLKKNNPKSPIILTGCFLKDTKNVIYVNKDKVVSEILRFQKAQSYKKIKLERRKTRALVKIQEGCNHFCSYCIVPYLRGRSRSVEISEIVDRIKLLVKQGYKEIVLVGTDITDFRIKNKIRGTQALIILLKKILQETKIERIRLSSFWPDKINDELIELIKNNSRICPHIHLSLQSCSEKILRLMGRNYKISTVKKIIDELKNVPNLSLTADVIVGFPGETKDDFQKTYNFIKSQPFLKLHIFRYSKRPFTAAAEMPNQLPEKIKKQRSKKLIDLSDKLSKKIRKKYLNKIFPVLFENKNKNGFWQGFTPNYIKVYLKSSKNLKNKIIDVKLKEIYQGGIVSEMNK